MKRILITMAALSVLAVTANAQGKKLVVKEKEGHIVPMLAKVTFPNEQTRTVMVIGTGKGRDEYMTHQLVVRTDGGASQRSFWLDALGSIRGTSEMRTLKDEFTVVLRNGTEVPAMFTNFASLEGCRGEVDHPTYACAYLWVQNEDESVEILELRKIKRIDFIGPVRRDKAGNAMYDTWRYSPFTGERLQ
jgi:hypothetical protein